MAVYLNSGDRAKTTDELMLWWVERAVERRAPGEHAEHETKSSIQAEGDRLYHYGHHFELARVLRTKGGRPKLILLNGDSWSGGGGWGNGTSSRQAQVRQLVEKTNVPYIVLPFSALSAAGISAETVVPLEVRPDRYEIIERTSNERPGPLMKMDDPSGATTIRKDQRWGHVNVQTGEPATHELTYEERTSGEWSWQSYYVDTVVPAQVDNPNHAQAPRVGHGWPETDAIRGEDGVWRWTVRRHWLGDSIFKARVTEERTRPANAAEIEMFEADERWTKRWRELRNAEDAARRTNSNAHFIDMKYQREEQVELGHIPPDRPTPEEMARAHNDVIDAVDAVRAHEDERPERPYNMERHRGTGRVMVRHTVRRTAKFLSSFDYNEPHAPYFLCELRYGSPARTVDEAIEDLKPQVVKDALAAGLDVLRHGDVFLIPTAYSTDELKSRGRSIVRRRIRSLSHEPWTQDVTETVVIRSKHYNESEVLGTNHSPTHAILTKDGEWFARGRMYHTPRQSWRRPEHRVLILGDGKTWYRCVKNTVPLDKASGSSRGNVITRAGGGRVFTGQSRAWMLGGAVD